MSYVLNGIDAGDPKSITTVNMFDPADYAVIDTTVDKVSGARETLYQRTDGNPEKPLLVRIGYYPKTDANGNKFVNVSYRIGFTVDELDGSSEVIRTGDGSAVLAWTMPWFAVVDNTQHFYLLSMLFSFVYRNRTSGALLATDVDDVKFGVTEIDLSAVART